MGGCRSRCRDRRRRRGGGGAEDADEDCEAWGSEENNAPTEGKDTLPPEACVYEE